MRYLVPLMLLLGACAAPVAQAPTPTPPPTALPPTAPPVPTATRAPTSAPTLEPTSEPTREPTFEPTPEPTLEPTPAPPIYLGAVEGRDAAGAYTLGDPNAALVLTDYSDFL